MSCNLQSFLSCKIETMLLGSMGSKMYKRSYVFVSGSVCVFVCFCAGCMCVHSWVIYHGVAMWSIEPWDFITSAHQQSLYLRVCVCVCVCMSHALCCVGLWVVGWRLAPHTLACSLQVLISPFLEVIRVCYKHYKEGSETDRQTDRQTDGAVKCMRGLPADSRFYNCSVNIKGILQVTHPLTHPLTKLMYVIIVDRLSINSTLPE